MFEWDEHKNIANRAKHGISFDEAKLIFDGRSSPGTTSVPITVKYAKSAWA